MSALHGRHALVVGGFGFIGLNLTNHLADHGARVTVLTPLRERHEEAAAGVERKGVTVVEGDLRDRDLMAHLVKGQQLVFNLSGQSGAVRSMEDPWTDLDVNLRGNLVLIESIRTVSPQARVIFAGSRLEYGKPASIPAGEDAAGDPLCVHAVHKRTVEEYLKLYGKVYGLGFAVARITNPYGPGQPKGRTAYGVINRLIHLALADDTLTIYGDGAQLRDYVHVDDVVMALVALATSPSAAGRAFNVGSGEGTRLAGAARTIIEIAGGGRIEHVDWPPLAEAIETGDFVADVSRIRSEIGWSPRLTLRAGLEQTIAHYRQG